MKKILVVGAGFAGATIARILHDNGYEVHVMDKRWHLGGNAHDHFDNQSKVMVHDYGPHLFHTNNEKVFRFLSRFTEWYTYYHKVKAYHKGEYYTLPVNRETKKRIGEENVLDVFFKPYTKKMWGKPLEEVNPKVIERVPMRDDDNELYFPNDQFQCLPKNGYSALFDEIFRGIPTIRHQFDHWFGEKYDHVFTSQSIDSYYSYIYGVLPYRNIMFHTERLYLPDSYYQPATTVNFTTYDGPTRCTEWKHMMEEGSVKSDWTTITYETPYETPERSRDGYYPIQTPENQALYQKYKAIPNDKTTFIGRCGTYQYLDMHQVVNQSMQIAEKFMRENVS